MTIETFAELEKLLADLPATGVAEVTEAIKAVRETVLQPLMRGETVDIKIAWTACETAGAAWWAAKKADDEVTSLVAFAAEEAVWSACWGMNAIEYSAQAAAEEKDFGLPEWHKTAWVSANHAAQERRRCHGNAETAVKAAVKAAREAA